MCGEFEPANNRFRGILLMILSLSVLIYIGCIQYERINGISPEKFFHNIRVTSVLDRQVSLPDYPIHTVLENFSQVLPIKNSPKPGYVKLKVAFIDNSFEYDDPGYIRGRFYFFPTHPYTRFTVYFKDVITQGQWDEIYAYWMGNRTYKDAVLSHLHESKFSDNQKKIILLGFWGIPLEIKETDLRLRRSEFHNRQMQPLEIEVEIFPRLTSKAY